MIQIHGTLINSFQEETFEENEHQNRIPTSETLSMCFLSIVRSISLDTGILSFDKKFITTSLTIISDRTICSLHGLLRFFYRTLYNTFVEIFGTIY